MADEQNVRIEWLSGDEVTHGVDLRLSDEELDQTNEELMERVLRPALWMFLDISRRKRGLLTTHDKIMAKAAAAGLINGH